MLLGCSSTYILGPVSMTKNEQKTGPTSVADIVLGFAPREASWSDRACGGCCRARSLGFSGFSDTVLKHFSTLSLKMMLGSALEA